MPIQAAHSAKTSHASSYTIVIDTHTFTLKHVVKIVYEDLTLKCLGGDSLQVLAVCVLSTLLSIAIPAKYKVTESTTYS